MDGQTPPELPWCILELMGHRRYAGRLSEREFCGGKLGRIDVPKGDQIVTTYFSAASVYCLTIVTEEVARKDYSNCQPEPVMPYALPANAPSAEVGYDAYPNEDDDEGDSDLDDDRSYGDPIPFN